MIQRLSIVLFLAPAALAQNNAPVSVSSLGALANNNSYYSLISADGRVLKTRIGPFEDKADIAAWAQP